MENVGEWSCHWEILLPTEDIDNKQLNKSVKKWLGNYLIWQTGTEFELEIAKTGRLKDI